MSTLFCCIDIEINPWCIVNPKARILRKGSGIKLLYKYGTWYYSGNKTKYCGDPLLKYADICKILCGIVTSVTVNFSWVGGNTNIFMPI